MIRRPPTSTLFLYTTLFRSHVNRLSLLLLAYRCRERSYGRQPVSLHPIVRAEDLLGALDRKSTRLNSSHTVISYAVFCLKKKKREQPSSPSPVRAATWRSRR